MWLSQKVIELDKIETFKKLWGKYLDDSQRETLLDGIIARGDLDILNWLWEKYLDDDQRNKLLTAITNYTKKSSFFKNKSLPENKKTLIDKYEYDFFISHASEDKESFVRDLAEELQERDFKVWYDDFTLTLGDSLRRKIDYGLANSCFGIVVLSKHFFEKEWTQKELDGLVAKERNGKKVILPIWHGVTREDVEEFSPILASRLAASTRKGLSYVVGEIIKAVKNS